MTVEALITANREQAKDAALDSSLAAAQFEAIIRAWKGEKVERPIPISPVGEADLDGSLFVRKSDITNIDDPDVPWTAYSICCSYIGTCESECTCTCYDPRYCINL